MGSRNVLVYTATGIPVALSIEHVLQILVKMCLSWVNLIIVDLSVLCVCVCVCMCVSVSVPLCSSVCLYIVCLLLWAKLPEISKHDDECKTYLSIISRCVCDIFKLGWFLYAKSINNVCMLLLFLGDFFHRSISWAYLAPYVTAGLQSSRPPRLQAVKRKCMAPPKSGRVRAWWPLTFRTK